MSDMSFKQAKELVEKFELTELTLKKTANNIDKATYVFNQTLQEQEEILRQIPIKDKKIDFLKLIVMLNVGFIGGLLVGFLLFNN